jgi:hypothetical protein
MEKHGAALQAVVATIQNKMVVGTVPYHDGGIDAKNKCNKQ